MKKRVSAPVRGSLDTARDKPSTSFREERGKVHPERSRRAREQGLGHVSVMTREVLEALALQPRNFVVDATYGAGGHTRALKAAGAKKVLSIDADPKAGATVTANFGDLAEVLKRQGIKEVDKVVFDLGWRREQLCSGKGFSFLYNEPLDMSYGTEPRSGFTAAEALNMWSEKAIADALFGYGEERYARRIAREAVERRKDAPFKTTLELVELINDAVPAAYRHGRIHPATRSFQALRIAVNDELRVLEQGLRAAWDALQCNGRIAVITFHSIEDRVVKQLFAEFAKHSGTLVYKKPLVPTEREVKENPAARSAKLRAIQKICHE